MFVERATAEGRIELPELESQDIRLEVYDNMTTIRRNLKNVVYNFTEAEVKVREATSNDPWGPPSTLMADLAEMTYSVQAYAEIMSMLWRRLNDHGKNWRHVYKSLVVLEYLVKNGSERVVRQCVDNLFSIQTLKDFQFLDKDGKDQGSNVREKAKFLVALLKDQERLKEERERAKQARSRLMHGHSGGGVSGDFGRTRNSSTSSDARYGTGAATSPTSPGERPVEQARPNTETDEQLQLELALRISKEEAEKEKRMRVEEEESLKAVLEMSKKEAVQGAVQGTPPTDNGNEDGLLGLNFGTSSEIDGLGDPWGAQRPPPPSYDSLLQSDPWTGSSSKQGSASAVETSADPWGLGPSAGGSREVQTDPWGERTTAASTGQQPLDPWSTSSAQPATNGDFLLEPVNPFSIDELEAALPPLQPSDSGEDSNQLPSVEEQFLGDLSALVNLDSLISMPPPTTGGGAQTAPNPFAPSYPVPQPATSNPFQQPKPRQPTLAELKGSSAQPGTEFLPPPLLPGNSAGQSSWQQQQPGNPFM